MNHRRTLRAPLARVMALCGAAALVSTSLIAGCSSQPSAAQKGEAGNLQVVAMGLTAAHVGAVTVTIAPASGSATTYNLAKNADGTWSGLATGLPVGTGYTLTLSSSNGWQAWVAPVGCFRQRAALVRPGPNRKRSA